MKNIFTILILATMVLGCSHQSTEPKSPCNEQASIPNDGDNFDKAGSYAADGSRWVYNASTKAWTWVSSEENKERLHRAWEATKQASSAAYNKAVETYHEHTDK